MTAFEIVNWLEVFLWPVLGLACVIGAKVKTGRVSAAIRVLAVAFLLFGLSDYIELGTGAWWKPAWLLLMKAACIVVFLWVGLKYKRASEKRQKLEELDSQE